MTWKFKSLLLLFTIKVTLASTDPHEIASKKLPKEILLTSPLTAPANTTEVCKTVWTNDGWICKADDLIKYAEDDTAKLAKGEAEYYSLLDDLKTLQTLFFATIPDFNNTWVHYHFHTKMRPKMMPHYKSMAKTCWQTMGKFRNSSLCFTCSAVNYKYYLSNKGLVPIEDCREMVSNCKSHFTHLVKLSYIMKETPGMFSTKVGDEAFALKLKTFLDNSIAWQLLWYYLDAPYETNNQSKAKVCEWTLRLTGTPILHSIIQTFKTAIQMITERLNNTPKRRLLMASNWQPRGLQLESLLSQEVLVTVFDSNNLVLVNPFTDSSNAASLSSNSPMNLSLAFP